MTKSQVLCQQGFYKDAIDPATKALRIAEANFPGEPNKISKSLNNLAFIYDRQGVYALSEPLYRRSLELAIQLFGPDHPNASAILKGLAACCRGIGRNDEAEFLEERSLRSKSVRQTD